MKRKIHIHLVAKQLFYAPLYIAIEKFNEENDSWEVVLVDKDSTNGDKIANVEYEIDYEKKEDDSASGIVTILHKEYTNNNVHIILTGDLDIISYYDGNKHLSKEDKDKIVLWYIFATRLPLLKLKKKKPKNILAKILLYLKLKKKNLNEPKNVLTPKSTVTLGKHHGKQEKVSENNRNSCDRLGNISQILKEKKLDSGLTTGDYEIADGFEIDKSYFTHSKVLQFSCFFSKKEYFDDKEVQSQLIQFFIKLEEASEELYKQSIYDNDGVKEEHIKKRNKGYLETLKKVKYKPADSPDGNDKDILLQLEEFAKRRIWQFDGMTGALTPFEEDNKHRLESYNSSMADFNKIFKITDTVPTNSGRSKYLIYEPQQRLIDKHSELRQQYISSAISSVMARNMSHNIGSHVLSRLVTPEDIKTEKIGTENAPYSSFYEHRNPNYKKEFIDKEADKIKDKFKEVKTALNGNDAVLEKVDKALREEAYHNYLSSNFFSYLKTRQDFLADVVSGIPMVQSSKWFMQELMEGIDKNRILLNRISGIGDNFRYRFIFNGQLCNCSGSKKIIRNGNKEACNCCKENDRGDRQVAISNDAIGQHAFYIILENIIRNTAKHGQGGYSTDVHRQDASNKDNTSMPNSDHKFNIRMEESKKDSSLYRITISDNIPKSAEKDITIELKRNAELFIPSTEKMINSENRDKAKQHKIKEGFHDYYLKRTDFDELEYIGSSDKTHINGSPEYDYFKISPIHKLIIQQNAWINEPILDSDFKLRQSALGLIEMEVCAAYMRRIPIEDIEHEDWQLNFSEQEIKEIKDPSILRAVKVKNEDNSCSLGYSFYLPKPKELLIIDETGGFWKEMESKAKEGLSENCNEDAIKNKVVEFLERFESNGILLLSSHEETKKKFNKEEWEKWHYESNKIYQHKALLYNGNTPKICNQKLPSNQISLKEVKDCFDKFKVVNDENKDFYNNKDLTDFLFLGDENIEQFITEIWRVIVSKKYTAKNLKPANAPLYCKYLNIKKDINNYTINFLHHGNGYSHVNTKIFQEIHGSYYEQWIKQIEEKQNNNRLKLQFLNAAITNVLVLDERIQELSETPYSIENSNKRPMYRELWNNANVYIPGKDELNLSAMKFEESYKTRIKDIICKQFGKNAERGCKYLDRLVIHLGIIEKILTATKNMEDVKGFLTQIKNYVFKYINEEKIPVKIIIISGRAPKDLPEDFSFLSYSVVSQYLIENRFKLHLNEILGAAHPKKLKTTLT